ncbi:MAG: uracil-DNA glycosylase family 4 [Paracoccaceae bacterium]|jgi:uracil-DNA glycosylase family 4
MDIDIDQQTAVAVLAWQIDLGVSEAIGDQPINRYNLGQKPIVSLAVEPPQAKPTAPALPGVPIVATAANKLVQASAAQEDAIKVAQAFALAQVQILADRATSVEALHAAILGFEDCELKRGARSTLFSDGIFGARVMVVVQPPTRAEEAQNRPLVDAEGLLFERMFDAIGLSRTASDPSQGLYICPALPWRTPQDRAPLPQELALLAPFLVRHIALAKPQVLVALGHVPCQMLLGQSNVSQLRGKFTSFNSLSVLPMLHPAQLLRNPVLKRDSWADLLALKAALSV